VNSFGGARPIEGVGTAVGAFVGLAADGPFNKPILVTNWKQYTATFGNFVQGTYLARAVHAYLNNGGEACYVVRIASTVAAPDSTIAAELTTGASRTGVDGDAFAAAWAPVDPVVYVEGAARQTGLGSLEEIEEVTMVCAPDLMTAFQNGSIGKEGLRAAHFAMISHCERMGDRMAILDAPPGLSAEDVREWCSHADYDSKFATIYWPWVKSLDPATSKVDLMPPSGFVAGIWGRVDASRGVHTAPANEVVHGAIDVESRVSPEHHDRVGAVGINVLRLVPGRGIRVLGARTLSSDPVWQHTNVRRLVNYLEQSILNGTDWVMPQKHDQDLWDDICSSIAGFLASEWRKGALLGAEASQSYYVKCDDEINPPDAEDRIVCEIGVAAKPNEFVVFRLSKFADGWSTMSESSDTSER
jgi:hypothetical protein